MKKNTQHSDVIVIGAGMAGLLISSALSKVGISCSIIDRADIFSCRKKVGDGRASAVSRGAKEILDKFGLWDKIKDYTGIIEQIRISDNHSPLFLHFDNNKVDGEPLGYMLENHYQINNLTDVVDDSDKVKIYSETSYTDIKDNGTSVTVTLDDGIEINAKLLIAADGKFSNIREMLGVKTYGWEYGQTAMVCNVSHELDHHNIAQEMFLPAGPFAILPLKGGKNSAIVWSEKSELVPIYMKMDEEEFTEFLKERFTDYLGDIKLASKRMAYPLSVKYSNDYYRGRIALLGDSAHAMHPIAGQGFNQTILDIECLVELLSSADDIGDPALLEKYQESRRADNLIMTMATDKLTKLFSNDIMLFKIARRLGIGAVHKIPFMQKFFMKYAMGQR